MENFIPDIVVMLGVFREATCIQTEQKGKRGQKSSPENTEVGRGARRYTGRHVQEAVSNPSQLPELQVVTGFKPRLSMYMVE